MKKTSKSLSKLDDYYATHEDIAKVLGLSRSRVEQIEKEALRKLASSKLMEFVR